MTNSGRLTQKRENILTRFNEKKGGRWGEEERGGERLFKSKISNRHSISVNGFFERCNLLGRKELTINEELFHIPHWWSLVRALAEWRVSGKSSMICDKIAPAALRSWKSSS